MGVQLVKEVWDGRVGEDTIEKKRRYTRRFEVSTDKPTDEATVVGGERSREMGLPELGEAYPLDEYALCVAIRPSNSSDDSRRWTVDCEYSTELPARQAAESQAINPATGDSQPTPGFSPGQRAENPLDRPPVYSIAFEQTTEIAQFNKNGEPILNCAGMPYDPPPEIDVAYPVITVTKNLAVVKFDWLRQFANAVNGDGGNPAKPKKWNGFDPRTARITGLSYSAKFENNVSFWEVQFVIKIRPQTWDKYLLEAGYFEKYEAAGGKWRRRELNAIAAGSGIQPSRPLLLDGNRVGVVRANGVADISSVTITGQEGRGQALPLVPDIDEDDPPQPIYTRWRVYQEKNFALLGI